MTVIGGDRRELEVIKGVLADGGSARACGCAPGATEILGTQFTSLRAAIAGADVLIGPIPITGPAGEVFAPNASQPVVFDEDAVADAKQGVVFLIGTATESLRRIAGSARIRLIDYGHDDELAVRRAPTVAEGALALIIANTELSIHGSPAVVVGFGRLGFTITRVLLALGATVTVVARDAAQRARAWELGAQTVPMEDLTNVCADAAFIVNTVPAAVITAAVLEVVPRRSFILDVSDPPGGTDLAAAKTRGLNAMLGRALGGRAPLTAGRNQWRGIRAILQAELSRR